MRLKILSLAAVLVLLLSCGKKEDAKGIEDNAETPVIKVADFETQAGNYVNKTVHIEGTVVHVCKHSGKRVFIVDGNDDVRVKIEAQDNSPGFKMELIGSKVAFDGIIEETRMTKAEIDERENEIMADIKAQKELGGESCEIDGSAQEKLDYFKELKAEMAKSGKSYVPFYSIRCSEYKEITAPAKS